MRALRLARMSMTPSAASALVATDIQAPVLVTRVDCHIVIDTDGRIARHESNAPLPAPRADRVRDLVLAKRFVPVEVDGRIVNAGTDMRVAITATKLDDGGMRLALENVSFPDPAAPTSTATAAAVHKVPPVFPRDALQARADADVLAVVRIGTDGRVRDVAIQQSALVHARARPADAAGVLGLFEKATEQALRQWRWEPSRMPASSRVGDGFVGYVPATFRIDRPHEAMPTPAAPGEWTLETRTARRVPEWLRVNAQAPQPDAADLADGELAGVNMRFRLAGPLGARAPEPGRARSAPVVGLAR